MKISLNSLRAKIQHHYMAFTYKREKLSEVVGAIEGSELTDLEINRVKTHIKLMREELEEIEKFLEP